MLFDNENLLSNEEIREQLLKDGIPPIQIDKIIQQFWIHDWGNSFIADKEHFELLREFLSTHKDEPFSRFNFYTYFYTSAVPDFDKLSESFQRIGTVFELMQSDHLEVADFENLIKELKLAKVISLQQLEESELITISDKEEKQIVTWTHHTLTEYLAAIYILRKGEIIKTVNSFMCSNDTGVITFIPSWAGTLRFLSELNPEAIIQWLTVNLKANPNFLVDTLAEVIVFETSSSINQTYRESLFHLIYDTYQENKWWIPVWAYHNLYKFIDGHAYSELKKHADDERYEIRGNVAAIIDGMLQNRHTLLTSEEKVYWKKKLISYANDTNTNGVLQRHSLAALENFVGDTSIIEAVSANYPKDDSLVREAFISLCRAVDPNSSLSIDFFIKAIAKDTSHIYARNALYSVSSAQGIKTLLLGIADNEEFIHEFLDKESIFNDEDKHSDETIIQNISKNLDEEITAYAKKFIINAFKGEKNYRAGDSFFLMQLALLIKSREHNYIDEIISTIQKFTEGEKSRILINNFEGLLSVLLEVNDLERLKGIFNDTLHHHAGYTLAEAVRLAVKNGNPNGKAILQKGIKLGITAAPDKFPQFEDINKNRELKVYKQFRDYLSPPIKGQYFPEVFRFFVENQKVIESQMTDDEVGRLLWLAVDSNLNKIDPEKIKVRYKDQENKSGEYTISSVAGYFADVLRLIQKLKPDILQSPENRKKVINFIPFAYSNDIKIIQDILGTVSDEELTTLNQLMMDVGNDTRYLIPQTYIYFAQVFSSLRTPKKVLISLAKDKLISESDRDYALRTLEKFITKEDKEIEKILLTIWNPKEGNTLSSTANALLISVFHNDSAIAWRFQTIKDSAAPYKRQEGVHSVGALEMELDNLAFARPLIELKDEKYVAKFIDLLNFSLSLNKDEKYKAYTNYLWRISIAFVVRENFFLSESSYQELSKWAQLNKTTPNINWFLKQLEMAVIDAKSARAKKNKVSEAIAALNP